MNGNEERLLTDCRVKMTANKLNISICINEPPLIVYHVRQWELSNEAYGMITSITVEWLSAVEYLGRYCHNINRAHAASNPNVFSQLVSVSSYRYPTIKVYMLRIFVYLISDFVSCFLSATRKD